VAQLKRTQQPSEVFSYSLGYGISAFANFQVRLEENLLQTEEDVGLPALLSLSNIPPT